MVNYCSCQFQVILNNTDPSEKTSILKFSLSHSSQRHNPLPLHYNMEGSVQSLVTDILISHSRYLGTVDLNLYFKQSSQARLRNSQFRTHILLFRQYLPSQEATTREEVNKNVTRSGYGDKRL